MQSEGDILRSFLAAWTALEIFVSKVFAEYESRIFQELNEGDYPDVRRQYLQRIQEVMKDKYTLANRFSVVSCQLCPSDADTDIKIFTTAKNMRDKLSHGQDVLEAALPVAEVQNLARKYLRLHLQSITKQ